MIHRNTIGNTLWIDLVSPSQKEISDIFSEFELDKTVSSNLVKPSIKPRYTEFSDSELLVLHFPTFSSKSIFGGGRIKEVDFVISKKVLITTRYESFSTIENLIKEYSESGTTDSKIKSPSDLFYVLMHKLYEYLFDEAEGIEHKLKIAEEKIFRGEEKEMVRTISIISREIIDFKSALGHHSEIIQEYKESSKKTLGVDVELKVKDLLNIQGKIETTIARSSVFLGELRITNDSLLSSKQNEVMKRFTILAFVFLPLNFISALFGMNALHMPIIGSRYDFYILLLLTAIVGTSTFLYFKFKKWL